MALEPAWLFLKATRTSAHPLGARGTGPRRMIEEYGANPARGGLYDRLRSDHWCENCQENVGPGEKCLCERQIDSAGRSGYQANAHRPKRPSSPGKEGGMQYQPQPDPYAY